MKNPGSSTSQHGTVSKHNRKDVVKIAVGVSGGVLFILIAIWLPLYFYHLRKRSKEVPEIDTIQFNGISPTEKGYDLFQEDHGGQQPPESTEGAVLGSPTVFSTRRVDRDSGSYMRKVTEMLHEVEQMRAGHRGGRVSDSSTETTLPPLYGTIYGAATS